MGEKLVCVPSSGEFFCNDGQTIRVRTSDGKANVTIQALFTMSQVKVVPSSGTTGTNGFLEVKVTCEGRCPTETEITFDADKPGYEPASFKVTCVKAGSRLEKPFSITLDEVPPGSSPSSLVMKLVEGIVPDYLQSLAGKVKVISEIMRAVRSEAVEGGIESVTNLSRTVAQELQQQTHLAQLFGLRITLFPPGIEFGDDEDTVTVSPTVGGTDNPDARANIGVQIDINPSGAGSKPVGRLTVGVDVDDTGKPKGGSFGFKCRF